MLRPTTTTLISCLCLASCLSADPLDNIQPSRIDVEKTENARSLLRKADLETKINYLLDRIEIQDLITSYAYSVDLRDWKLHQSVFTEIYENGSGGVFRKSSSAQRIKNLENFFQKFEGTQHLNLPLLIEIEGDKAYAVSSINARHFHSDGTAEKNTLLTGQYEFWCIRTEKGWKVNRMNMVNRRRLSMEPKTPRIQ